MNYLLKSSDPRSIIPTFSLTLSLSPLLNPHAIP